MNAATRPKTSDRSRELLRLVPIAWPTLALGLAALGLWVSAVIMGSLGLVPAPIAVILGTVSAYAAFTPMHDASHRSVGRTRWLNEVVGRLMAVPLMAPFPAFRWLHLEHHKHTNDAAKDPDFWSGGGRSWTLPLRWCTQNIHYYYVYLRAVRKRPRAEVIEIVTTFVATYSVAGALAVAGYGMEMLLFWVLPSQLGIGLLAFAFDYLPHRPHNVPASVDRYQATGVVENRWLTPLLLSQNYHLVHHLHPGVPFYRYGQLWWARREMFMARGARIGFGQPSVRGESVPAQPTPRPT